MALRLKFVNSRLQWIAKIEDVGYTISGTKYNHKGQLMSRLDGVAVYHGMIYFL